MPSQRKIDANRANARLSTGPKTPEGKAKTRLNALKHGLLASDAVLPDESTPDFLELLAAFHDQFDPATPEEEILVHQVVLAHWRLRRLTRVENGLFADHLNAVRDSEDEDEEKPTLKQQYDHTTCLLGLAFTREINGSDSFTTLCRYEAMVRRALYRALERLDRLRARRRPAPPKPSPSNDIKENYETNPTPPLGPSPANAAPAFPMTALCLASRKPKGIVPPCSRGCAIVTPAASSFG